MARVLAFVAVVSFVACKESPMVRPDPAPPSSAAALTKAVTPAPPAPLTSDQRAAVRRADESASSALRAKDRVKLKSLGGDALDVDRALTEVSDTECLGDVIEDADPYDGLVVRHNLGFKSEELRSGGRCEGVHEIRMHYTLINDEPRLTSVNRWGW